MSGKPFQHGLFEQLEPRVLLAGNTFAAAHALPLSATGASAAGNIMAGDIVSFQTTPVDARSSNSADVVAASVVAPAAAKTEPPPIATGGDQRAQPAAVDPRPAAPLSDKPSTSPGQFVQTAPVPAVRPIVTTPGHTVSIDPVSTSPAIAPPVQSPPAREPMKRSATAPAADNRSANQAEQSLAVARSIAVKLPSVTAARETSVVAGDGSAGSVSRVVKRVKQISSALVGVAKIRPTSVSTTDLSVRDAARNVAPADLSDRGAQVLATAAVRQEAIRVTATIAATRDVKAKEASIDAATVRKQAAATNVDSKQRQSDREPGEGATALHADPTAPVPETASGDQRVAAAAFAPPPPAPETTGRTGSETTAPTGQDVPESSVRAPFDQPSSAGSGDTPGSAWPAGSGGPVHDRAGRGVELPLITATDDRPESDGVPTDRAPEQGGRSGGPVTAAVLTVTMGNPLTRLVVAGDGGDQVGTGSAAAMPRGAGGLGRRRRRRSAGKRTGQNAEIDDATQVGWQGPPPDGSANGLADLAIMTYLEDLAAPAADKPTRGGPAAAPATGTDWYQTSVVIGAGSLAGSAALLALDRRRFQPQSERPTRPARPTYTGPTAPGAGPV